MKRKFLLLFILMAASPVIFSQGVKISATPGTPDGSSILEIQSDSKGFLQPRLSTAERDAISPPIATGLQIYNTTTNCINVYTGSSWKQLCPECEFSAPIAGSDSPVCEGGTIHLTATSISGASYTWSGPGGFSSTQQNPSIANAAAQHIGNYFVTATVNGCSATSVAVYVSLSSVGVSTPSSNGPVCEGTALFLTASSVPGATYSWTGPGGYVSSEQNPVIASPLVTNSGLYSVTPSIAGCIGQPNSVVVTINAAPVSTFIYDQQYPVPNNAVNFTPTVAGNSYSWSFQDGSPISSSAENPSASWSAAGFHNVQLTATQGGCSASTTVAVYIYTPQTFNYTGSEQTFTVPEGINSVYLEVFGAQGGTATYSGTDYGQGGLGGKAVGVLAVTPGEELKVYAGQRPSNYQGGWNGGGSSGLSSYGETRGGGGASDVRQGGNALTNRKIVAGGGGSSCVVSMNGGVGGGASGGSTNNYSCCGGQSWTGAGGGTQTEGGYGGTGASNGSAGSLGTGGNGGPVYGGGGGGGYYGGGGGSGSAQGQGYSTAGGGGSSYIGGVSNGSTVAGVNAGHGKVIVYW